MRSGANGAPGEFLPSTALQLTHYTHEQQSNKRFSGEYRDDACLASHP
jgi:hypothetical protein